MSLTKEEIREYAETDLCMFAKLVNPHRVYGNVHEELFAWWQRSEAKNNQLVLLPRDHQKSHCMAVRVAWEITRNPAITIVYVSATADLAEKQLRAIKQILTSPIYTRYWSDMIANDEGRRSRWTNAEIEVDHPLRAQEGVRDPTVAARGITANITGLHCDIAVLDDVVVPKNAYTDEGRGQVASLYSQLSSIETTNAKELVVGTRYHIKDLYSDLLKMEIPNFDEETGEETGAETLYEIFERVVEDSPGRDGTGEFLWARERRKDGKPFGFNRRELSIKKAKYLAREQFYSQYYNDPNDASMQKISRDCFQYYNKDFLSNTDGRWYYQDRELYVFAAMDFAFSRAKTADYTAIVVVGVDYENQVYVLDVNRFKTDKISDMFNSLLHMYRAWDFRKVSAEVSIAQKAIVNEFKQYMRQAGVFFSIEEHRPTRHDGTKEERMDATLLPRYEAKAVFHYKGGLCYKLEEELMSNRPEHDDIKDALANAINITKAPMVKSRKRNTRKVVQAASRFGGG